MALVKKRPCPHSDEECPKHKRQRHSPDPDTQLSPLIEVRVDNSQGPDVGGVGAHVDYHKKEVQSNIIDYFVSMVTIQLSRVGIVQRKDPNQ